jgi:hypothetical protein
MKSRVTRPVVRPIRKRRRGAHWLFAMSALVMSTAFAARPAAAQPPVPVPAVQPAGLIRFDIPAGPLDEALRAFEATTGLIVDVRLPADTVHMMQSPGVSGMVTLDAALDAVLDGTSLVAVSRANGVITVDLRGLAESVQVTGRLPHVASPRYATPLSETPQSIQVIPQAVLAEQGAFTLSDAMRNVPGIALQAGEGGGASGTAGDMFNMRGFSAASSLFVDNVRRRSHHARRLQSRTGRGLPRAHRHGHRPQPTAGYVNMVTKAPQPVRPTTPPSVWGRPRAAA